MKKRSCFGALLLGACMLFCGCAEMVTSYDPNKTQIFVSVFDGGYGTEWIDKAAAEFNEGLEDYEVIVQPNKSEEGNILSTFQSGYPSADIYYTSTLTNIKSMIGGGYLIDLSDVYARKGAPEDSLTIEGKMRDADLYKEAFSDTVSGTSGVYALPYGDSFIAPVYDNDTFIERGWAKLAEVSELSAVTASGITAHEGTISVNSVDTPALIFDSATRKTNFEAGDPILSAGKDGVYGTYDDGQPQTVEEYTALINMIVGQGNKAFIFSGSYLDYSLPFTDMIFAQYMGTDAYLDFFTYEGTIKAGTEITNPDGTKQTLTEDLEITRKNGYLVWENDGLEQAIRYTYNYMYGGGQNYHPACDSSSVSHGGAQNSFILGYRGESSNPLAAMLMDGPWWEYEARAMFNDPEVISDGRGYGERDYRYMLFPYMDGQKGIGGEGGEEDNDHGSVLSATDTGAVFAYKGKDERKNQLIKDFIALTTSDKYLREFSKSGGLRPFNFELSDEEYAALTPGQQAAWDIHNDTQNVAFVRKNVYRQLDPVGYATAKTMTDYSCSIDNTLYGIPFSAFTAKRGITADIYIEAMQSYYRNQWPGYVQAAGAIE